MLSILNVQVSNAFPESVTLACNTISENHVPLSYVGWQQFV